MEFAAFIASDGSIKCVGNLLRKLFKKLEKDGEKREANDVRFMER